MPVLEKKSPVDHLRSFVSSLMEKTTQKEEPASSEPTAEEQTKKPFRGRESVFDKGEDRTKKFLLMGAGGLLLFIFLILALSQKHVPHRLKSNAPDLGRAQQSQGTATTEKSANLVPRNSMEPVTAENAERGKVTAKDLESNVPSMGTKSVEKKPVTTMSARTLGEIAPFRAGQPPEDNWTPKPYPGQVESSSTSPAKAEAAALAKPSLVFVSNATPGNRSSGTVETLTPSLGLGAGTRLSARITSMVTTAVDVPILAVVEYNYEQNGEIVVPAGAVAVGHIQQADRSGYLSIRFDRLEMPDKSVVPIDAVATNRNLGPLKGKVTGTHAGRSFLVRSVTGIGSAAAMLVGQNNTGGSISEDDLLRADLAENMGRAGDQQVMQLMMAEHPLVTLSAGSDVFLVFEKTENRSVSTTVGASPSRLSQQNLNELRELLQIQREMNANIAPPSSPSSQ
jgi:hypothetical protein